MACKDPSITYLNKFGYNVVRLPRAGVEPLDVVGRDRTTEWLGPLSSVWRSSLPVPVPGPPRPAVDVQGRCSGKIDLSIGLRILANALKAFGAATSSLEFAFQRTSKLTFTFTNVASVAIAPLQAGNYLSNGDLDTRNPIVRNYFLDDEDRDAQAYLIFDVLKSDSITIHATSDSSAHLDLPAIQSAVGTNVAASWANNQQSALTFRGPSPVTFGFRAMEIHYVDGAWSLEGAKPSGAIAFAASHQAGDAAPVLIRPGFVRL
jgi:hypothetical protein